MLNFKNILPKKNVKISDSDLLTLLVGLVVATGLWMYIAKLDVVSATIGSVVPSSQIKTIQHLEGGIVSKIYIKEGQQVSANQPLLDLESTDSEADVGEMLVRLATIRVKMARLEAESNDSEVITFKSEIEKRTPKLAQQERELFKARRDSYLSGVASQQGLVVQKEQAIQQVKSRLSHSENKLKLLQEQISISDELLKDELTNRYNHITLLKDESALFSQIDEDIALIKGSDALLVEAQEKLNEIRLGYQANSRGELEESRREHSELSQRMEKLKDSLKRTVLRAPVDGTIKTLNVHTVGGVIRAGETVIEIVPVDDMLLIEVSLPPQDVGFVQVGQTAQIRLASADATRLGKLDGKVIHISPDSIVNEEGVAFYKVRIETEKSFFERNGLKYYLSPGVQVSASIVTGERTVFEYLFEPFLGGMERALKER
ncbi:MAG TPA: HlyD family type I secretion periplasmic adaptor subunit [Gammaproteobacteria bacterium]|nr:HlyD family type I secretion periplasmic adaptor subunit [Gammaproteobacteria bacterium]